MKESDDSVVSGIKDNGKKWRYVLYFCLTDSNKGKIWRYSVVLGE
jgi:hypothetical protein